MKSFLKWVGGKMRLMDKLNNTFPDAECLVEPFMGSGTVFLNTKFPKYILSDINPDLILLMHVAKDAPDGLIEIARELFLKHNNAADYYEIRRSFNEDSCSPILHAAQFLYFNRHGFNGLCRYSSNGFNVPYGNYKTPYFPEFEIRAFAAKCRQCEVQFKVADFTTAINDAPDGSLIYADPPYVPASKTANFQSYHKDAFNQRAHEELTSALHAATLRGCSVVLSQSDTELTREIYHGFEFKSELVGRPINSNGARRGKVPELIGTLLPPPHTELATELSL